MVEKARDAIRTSIARPEEIAFVTFTNKAADEIRSRCQDISEMKIGTIHHLANLVIQQVENKKPRLSTLAEDDNERRSLTQKWLLEAIAERPQLLLDLELRREAVRFNRVKEGEAPQRLRVPPDGALVRSFGEAQIAATLYLAKIPYQYEAEFPLPDEYRTKQHTGYRPDFYLPDDPLEFPSIKGGIWLEHFANDRHGELPQHWDQESPGSVENYRRTRIWKEKLHKSLRTRFVKTEFGDIQRCMTRKHSFPDFLLQLIAQKGKVGIQNPSKWDIESELLRMKAESGDNDFLPVTCEIDKWIRTKRQQIISDDQLVASIENWRNAAEAGSLFRLAYPVLKRYERHLTETKTTDHEGTILKALEYIQDGKIQPPWKVVLVDEYQDVNPAQAAFIHALLKPRIKGLTSTGARLTAVGDDWQAIFGFQGGDTNLILDFNDPAKENDGWVERVELKRTYRFGQEIADTARHFVTRGRSVSDRKVIGSPDARTHPKWPTTFVVTSTRLTEPGKKKFSDNHIGHTASVLAVLSRIAEQSQNAEVLIAGRRNSDLTAPNPSEPWRFGIDRKEIEIAAKQYDIRLSLSTIHKATGLEADYVILLDSGPLGTNQIAKDRALTEHLETFANQTGLKMRSEGFGMSHSQERNARFMS